MLAPIIMVLDEHTRQRS